MKRDNTGKKPRSLVKSEQAQFQLDVTNKILIFHDKQVMVDRDLAEFYQVETKRLNEQVKRNIDRFPPEFRFQLSKKEFAELVANCDRFASLKHSTSVPYVFTEQGVAMLSAVLHSKTAVDISIKIIKAFVEMRKFLIRNAEIFQRLDKLEIKQIEHVKENDKKFELLFDALEKNQLRKEYGIFYDGQIFDAYELIAEIIRGAKTSLVVIDNYIDDSVLKLFAKRRKGVSVDVYTKNITGVLEQDVRKFNEQYEPISVKELKSAHDRFIILDKSVVYHFGASLKDAGKKWFAFSKLSISARDILDKLKRSHKNG